MAGGDLWLRAAPGAGSCCLLLFSSGARCVSQTQGCSCRLYLQGRAGPASIYAFLAAHGQGREGSAVGFSLELTSTHCRNELALRRARSLHNCGSVHSSSVQDILLLETEIIISAFFLFSSPPDCTKCRHQHARLGEKT